MGFAGNVCLPHFLVPPDERGRGKRKLNRRGRQIQRHIKASPTHTGRREAGGHLLGFLEPRFIDTND